MNLPRGMRVVQVAYATTDVRAAAQRLHERYGAGPFYVREHVPMKRVTVEGADGVFDHSCAIGQWGEVMVEFVHHHRLEPLALEHDLLRGRAGLHHVACFVEDVEAARDQLVSGGARLVMDAETPEVRFMFLDPGPDFGHLIEIYEGDGELAELYRRVRLASEGWDGTRVIRERR